MHTLRFLLLQRKAGGGFRVNRCCIEHGNLNVLLIDEKAYFRAAQDDTLGTVCDEVLHDFAKLLFR